MPLIEIRYKKSFGNPQHLVRAREELRKIIAEELTEQESSILSSDVDVMMIPIGEYDIMDYDFQFNVTVRSTPRRLAERVSIITRMEERIRKIPSLADAGHFSSPPHRPQCQSQKSGIWLLLPEAEYRRF